MKKQSQTKTHFVILTLILFSEPRKFLRFTEWIAAQALLSNWNIDTEMSLIEKTYEAREHELK